MKPQHDLLRMIDRAAASVSDGLALRHEGIRRVDAAESDEWKRNFATLAERFLAMLPIGGEFTGETIRLYCQGRGIGSPHHPNCWPANVSRSLRQWIKAGRVQEVGSAQAWDPRSHARRMVRYRKDA